jgi:hypothetical protein
MKLAMKRVLLAALLGAGSGHGCSHEARPAVAPDEHPPLPPASGSPIGHLVDDAAGLKLRDDQLARLREIDEALGAKLAASETALRTGEPDPRNNRPDAPRGLGFHAGGAGATIDKHGTVIGTPVAGGASGFPSETPQTRRYVVPVGEIEQARARDTRDAIRRALAVLDVAQRAIARRVLTDHGVNPDTGEATGGEPGAPPDGTAPAPLKPAEP